MKASPATVIVAAVQRTGFTHESTHNESVERYTPPHIFDALGLTFDMDPCSPGEGKSFVPALRHNTVDADGLTSPWLGTAWVNPPYGSQTPAWMEKLAIHGDDIALLFARTDVKWFHNFGVQANLICFVRSRVKFFQGDMESQPGTPGTGSMLLTYGAVAATALRNSGLGACFTFDGETHARTDCQQRHRHPHQRGCPSPQLRVRRCPATCPDVHAEPVTAAWSAPQRRTRRRSPKW